MVVDSGWLAGVLAAALVGVIGWIGRRLERRLDDQDENLGTLQTDVAEIKGLLSRQGIEQRKAKHLK